MTGRVFWIATLLLFLITVFPVLFSTEEISCADPTGCCKQRQTPDSEWYANNLNFSACQQLNGALDGNDDIFQPSGRVWWDLHC